MISIPNLPSDSLYKFTFIGGLFSFFLCLYLSYGLLSDNLNQKMDFITKIIPEEGQKWYQDTLNMKRYKRLDSQYNLSKNIVEKEKLMEKLMLLSDQSAEINYNESHYKNILESRKLNNKVTFQAICILLTIGCASLIGASIGWEKWDKQQKVLDGIMTKQFELQKLEVEIKELELREKLKAENLVDFESTD